MTDLVTEKRRKAWRNGATRSKLELLDILLDFRKDVEDWRAEGVLMEAYQTFAEETGFSIASIRLYMGIVREYEEDCLREWIGGGFSFDHIQKANAIAPMIGDTPINLLMAAFELSGPEGNRKLTVAEAVTLWLGDMPEAQNYRLTRLVNSLLKFNTDHLSPPVKAEFEGLKERMLEILEGKYE